VQLTAMLNAQPGSVTVTALGRSDVIPVKPDGTAWLTALELRPGENTIDLEADVPPTTSPVDPRRLAFQVTDLAVRAPAMRDALCRFESGATRPGSCP
jgi:hypothetical protein